MKRWTRIACVAIGLMATMSTIDATAADAQLDALRAVDASWAKAFNGGDGAGVAALYADDAILLPPGAPGVKGGAAIKAYFAKEAPASKAAGATFVLDPKSDAGRSGELGWVSGTYHVMIKGAVVETGKFLSVSRRTNGQWKYLRDTWNQDAPPPAAAAK